jgi:signal-transduction protein with cAMP-binding, CBS, and nucleotidyltransferase domain
MREPPPPLSLQGASLDATAFLFSHPLFAGCTKSEMAQVLTGVKVMSLDQMSLLFRAGQSVPDVYLVRQGEIELRTELEIHRDDLSAGEKHLIPSATVNPTPQSPQFHL